MVMVFCFGVLNAAGFGDATSMGLCRSLQVPKSLTWSEASIMRSWLHRARDSLQAEQTVVRRGIVTMFCQCCFCVVPKFGIDKDREVFPRIWTEQIRFSLNYNPS